MSSSASQATSGVGEEEGGSVASLPLTNGSNPSPKPKQEADDSLPKDVPIPILATTTITPKLERVDSPDVKTEDAGTPHSNGDESRGEDGAKGHPERKRKLSTDSLDSSVTKLSAEDGKDDDDDNDDDDDEKLVQDADPERLKAFNMFVRLFVDENLDRMTPISKQPKDKVQAILEACDRQFPEFHERSRKRIRTYLKSCRRLKRSKDANGFETLRPTPPHLTSAAAESILAQACENESQNAKRMRIGLEPLPAAVMNPHPPVHHVIPQQHHNGILSSALTGPVVTAAHKPSSLLTATSKPPLGLSPHSAASSSASSAGEYLRHIAPVTSTSTPAPPFMRSPHDLSVTGGSVSSTAAAVAVSPFAFTNGTSGGGVAGAGAGLFRAAAGFPSGTFTPPAHQHPLSHAASLASSLQNGPTDLSVKGGKTASTGSKSQLNANEISTIKQLIAGYRESAAFLYASADELEQLLLQQN